MGQASATLRSSVECAQDDAGSMETNAGNQQVMDEFVCPALDRSRRNDRTQLVT